MQTVTLVFFLVVSFTFALTVTGSRILIPKLRRYKCEQMILEIGPNWHQVKAGTPTMGGLAFIVAILVVAAGATVYFVWNGGLANIAVLSLTLCFALANGLVGVIDDLAKLRHAKNEGLTPGQKYLLQLLLAVVYLFLLSKLGGLRTSIDLPFTNIVLDFGIFYYPFAILLITGFVNSVNLTDGIDGLAASVTTVVGLFFGALALKLADMGLSLTAALLVGGCLGFLVFNHHPAKVFMGDTGSLFLGAMVIGLAFLADRPLLLFFAGIVYWLEALSDILQVGWYKLTKRRIFRMAPLHHHFEMQGFTEVQIVITFTMVTLLFCIVGFFAH